MKIDELIRQKSYEKIEHVLRRHPITFIPKIILFLVLLCIPAILYLLLTNMYPLIFDGPVIYPLAVMFTSVYLLSVYLFFFAQFIEFYLDVWIITNDRIIDVEQLGLISRSVSEVDLFRKQDVTSDVQGVVATFFNYGKVAIKTASVNVNIIAHDVSAPNKIREALIRLAHEDRKYHYNESINK